MKNFKTLKIFIIAGEASGDNLGGKLCRELKKQANCNFYGIGGSRMIFEGVKTIFPIEEISLFGLMEIIPHLKRIFQLIKKTVAEIKAFDPDIIITIDSPGFCFQVIKNLANLRAKKIHYIAPSIWLRPKRAYFMAKYYDKVLAILPFEPRYFSHTSLNCKFIGHPLLEDGYDKGDGKSFRKKHKILSESLLLTAMTGSRKSEVQNLALVFIDSINKFIARNKLNDVVVAFPLISEYQEALIYNYARERKFRCIFVSQDEKKDLYAASNLALVKSGTSSLELAVAKVPMVVAYKVSKVTEFIAKYILRLKGYISIINILANQMVIPEKLQRDCNPEILSNELSKLLNQQNAKKQITECQQQIKKLKSPGDFASKKAASEVLKALSGKLQS